MRDGLADAVRRRGGLILDGAMGTLIEDQGVSIGNALWGSTALLTEEGRELTERLHRGYVDAGADIVTANTHNASLSYSKRFILEHGAAKLPTAVRSAPEPAQALMELLNRAGMTAARRAVAKSEAKVAACLASPDVPYTPTATLSADELATALDSQLEVILSLKPDLILFEMCTTLEDIKAVSLVLPKSRERPPAGVGLVFGEDGRTLGGVEPQEALEHLHRAGFEVVFVQCTRWDLILTPLAELSKNTDMLTGAYGNDGRRWENGGWVGERVTPRTYAEAVEGWWQAGGRVLGGCCGTCPDHISAIAHRLEPLRARAREPRDP